MFSFLLRGQKRKYPQRDSSQDNIFVNKNMVFNKITVSGSDSCYLFSFLSKENKSNNNLCVLCASAVSPAFNGIKDPFRVTIQATLFRGGG